MASAILYGYIELSMRLMYYTISDNVIRTSERGAFGINKYYSEA